MTIDQADLNAKQPKRFAKALTGTLVAGQPRSLFYLAGIPGPGSAPTPGIGGEILTSAVGQIPWTNPSSPNYAFFYRLSAMATQGGVLTLCDRIWQNSGLDVTLTSEQVFTGAAQIPSRDANFSNSGHGVYAGVELSAAVGAATPTLTLKYTDQDGNAGATATNIVATTSSAAQGAFFPIGLAAGDAGVRKAESLQLSASWVSGTIHTVLYRELMSIELNANIPNAIDHLSTGLQRWADNIVPFLIFTPNTTTTSNISGNLITTEGS